MIEQAVPDEKLAGPNVLLKCHHCGHIEPLKKDASNANTQAASASPGAPDYAPSISIVGSATSVLTSVAPPPVPEASAEPEVSRPSIVKAKIRGFLRRNRAALLLALLCFITAAYLIQSAVPHAARTVNRSPAIVDRIDLPQGAGVITTAAAASAR